MKISKIAALNRWLGNFGLVLASVCIAFLLFEAGLRVYCRIHDGVAFLSRTDVTQSDPLLGWKPFVSFGDPHAKKFKIFFVGDSFTENYIPLKYMYYGVVQALLDVEIFVCGGRGYGTFQEYLAIDKYIDVIKPDLIVLQVCSNDFVNNSWNLERRSFLNNNYMLRPYYENKRAVYRFPRGSKLAQLLIPYSRLAYTFFLAIDTQLAWRASNGKLETVEKIIEREELAFKGFENSVATTTESVGLIKKRASSTPVVAMPVFDDEPYFSQFKKIFAENNITFLEMVPPLARKAEMKYWRKNKDHWTIRGQQIAGLYLKDYIKNRFGVVEKGKN